MKKTKYLPGLVALSLGSVFLSACHPREARQTAATDWTETDTVPGKVVHDEKGNEWIWHGSSLSNMMMGYWLINSISSGVQSRYYPSSRQYTTDMGTTPSPITRPATVSSVPVKAREGMMKNVPTAANPLNRSALKAGYVVPSASLQPSRSSATSVRKGFGRTGVRSVGS